LHTIAIGQTGVKAMAAPCAIFLSMLMNPYESARHEDEFWEMMLREMHLSDDLPPQRQGAQLAIARTSS
jgi:hypothetical protein